MLPLRPVLMLRPSVSLDASPVDSVELCSSEEAVEAVPAVEAGVPPTEVEVTLELIIVTTDEPRMGSESMVDVAPPDGYDMWVLSMSVGDAPVEVERPSTCGESRARLNSQSWGSTI